MKKSALYKVKYIFKSLWEINKINMLNIMENPNELFECDEGINEDDDLQSQIDSDNEENNLINQTERMKLQEDSDLEPEEKDIPKLPK